MWVPPSRPVGWGMAPPRRHRLSMGYVLLLVLVTVVSAAAAYVVLRPDGGAAPAPVQASPSIESGTPTDVDGPVQSAERWLEVYQTISYTDPQPTAWIDRVLPLSTERFRRELARLRGGSPGADWTTFVANQCRTTLDQLHGTIPAEAPRTADSAWVQLSATAVTRCAAAARATREDIALTVGVRRGDDGTWRVDRRLS